MKTMLVTGGCGFIGSNFIKCVLENHPGWRMVNLDALTYAGNPMNLSELEDNERYDFVKGDICDAALVEKLFAEHGFDAVVNFAAESHVDRSIMDPDAFIKTNVMGTFTLLEQAKKAWEGDMDSRRFLHVSTDEVYGSLGAEGYFTELTPYDPRSPYSASKASSDHLARAYHHTYGLPVLVTNCSNNYGPLQFPEKLIPLMIHNALNGKPLPVYGDGKNVRDWLYVTDHCAGLMAVAEKGRVGETYCLGGNNEKQNIEIVNTICALVDERAQKLPSGESRSSLITYVTDRPGHDRRYAIDASKIEAELGWSPLVGFEEGMRLTIDWYLENAGWVDAVMDGSYREYYRKLYDER